MPRDVFISHSAQDKKVSETICAALEQSGIRCWIAPRDVRAGKSFPGEITRAIQQSKVMLLIFSRHSNSSEQVLREVQLAVDSHLPIVRLRIEDIPLSDDLRYYLSTPHWLDALSHPLSKHIPPVAAAIKELLEQANETPAVAAESAPVEVAMKQRTPADEEKSAPKWKSFAIGTVVLAAALIITFWALRSPNKNVIIATPSATPSAQPSPQLSPSPVPSPLPSPSPTPTATPVESSPTPTPSPTPTATNKKAPVPRNNRAWQVWIDEFVHNFIASNETNDLDLALSFYAPNVELFEEGRKSDEAIRSDIATYNARWPSRRATIRGDVRLSEKAPNRNYTASFEHDYYVENPSRGEWINGAVAVELQITVGENGFPKIVSMKQKTLRKEKGTMQPKPSTQTDQPSTSPAAIAAPSASSEPVDLANLEPHLVRVRNTRYNFSAMVPATVFPNVQTTFTADRQAFTSTDGKAILTFYVERNGSAQHLRESYDRWSAEHTKTEPDKIVDYKVLRDNWFVVSGQNGERGFYLKTVAKHDVLEFMHLDCDENHYPVKGETLTAMSRSFDGN